jgi:hypothetical protein
MKLFLFSILLLMGNLAAQPSEVYEATFEVQDQGRTYPFIVRYLDERGTSFDWEMPQQDISGTIVMQSAALANGTKVHNYFTNGLVELDAQTTSTMVSKTCLRNLKAGRTCILDGKSLRKMPVPNSPRILVNNEAQTGLIYAQAPGLKLWIKDAEDTPIIVRMEERFTVTLKTYEIRRIEPPQTGVVLNNTNNDFYYFYVRPAGSTNWGDDQNERNGNSPVLNRNERITLSLGNGCKYDIKGEGRSRSLVFEAANVDFCTQNEYNVSTLMERSNTNRPANPPNNSGNTNRPMPSGEATLISRISTDIYYLYVRPAGSAEWGADQNGLNNNQSIFNNGDSAVIKLENGCRYDIKGERNRNTATFEVFNIDLCQNRSLEITDNFISRNSRNTGNVGNSGNTNRPVPPPPPPSQNQGNNNRPPNRNTNVRTGQIINETEAEIYYLYVRPTGTNDWGGDQNENDGNNPILRYDEAARVNLTQGCRYDIMAQGDEDLILMEQYNIDLCRNNPYRITEDLLTDDANDGDIPGIIPIPDMPTLINLNNRSNLTVQNLFIMPANGNENFMDFNFGEHLFNGIIRPRGSDTYQPEECSLNWVAFDNSWNYIGGAFNQEVCDSETINITKLTNGLKVRNRLAKPIKGLQFGTGNNMGEDILEFFGLLDIPVGQLRILPPKTLGEGCAKNIKVTFSDNTTRTIRNVNTCAAEIILR